MTYKRSHIFLYHEPQLLTCTDRTMVTMVFVDPKCLFKLVNNMMKPQSKKFMLMVMENLTKVCRFKPMLGGSYIIFLRIVGFVSFFML